MKKIYNLLIVATIMITASCSKDGSSGGSSDGGSGGDSGGKGGSMARFCITGDMLCTVDQTNLKLFDISEPADPAFLSGRTQQLGFDIETIFPKDSLLFIGSQDGMYIYYISNLGFPQSLSKVSHIRSCDPVVAEGNYAYVTLNSNNVWCGRTSNILQIYNITDLTNPKPVKDVIGFTSPMGLGTGGDRLFICDNGLKVYDITERTDPIQIADLHTAGVHDVSGAYDVIVMPHDNISGVLILVASSGIYQLEYADKSLKLLSKIEVKQ
ncbi:MAG: hypothetical protein LBE04_06560 [Prevotellaceae bacterium]|jgi:hypothetical protein|nr:hypothetical protein [Prevotellaceae bacterium]